jgi:hypothetical protein
VGNKIQSPFGRRGAIVAPAIMFECQPNLLQIAHLRLKLSLQPKAGIFRGEGKCSEHNEDSFDVEMRDIIVATNLEI